MRRSASEIIRNLEMRIARLESATRKTASQMPSFAEGQLLDEIYEEMDMAYEAKEIVDLDAKMSGSNSVFLVSVGEVFAVVKCSLRADDCRVEEITTNRREAHSAFRSC
jgi:hypothetical protein